VRRGRGLSRGIGTDDPRGRQFDGDIAEVGAPRRASPIGIEFMLSPSPTPTGAATATAGMPNRLTPMLIPACLRG
jgi:hypothetical protein